LNHRDQRLAEANELVEVEAYRERLGNLEFDYLTACQVAELLVQRWTRRMQALLGLLIFGVVTGSVGWLNESYLQDRMRWFTTMQPYMITNVRPYVLTAEAGLKLKPKDSFRECAKDCPEMIVIPPGEFIMGSSKKETDRDENEGPQHKVIFAKPFAVSKFEVTFDEWDACVAVGGCAQVADAHFTVLTASSNDRHARPAQGYGLLGSRAFGTQV